MICNRHSKGKEEEAHNEGACEKHDDSIFFASVVGGTDGDKNTASKAEDPTAGE